MADITLTTTESNIVVDASNNIIQVSSTPTTIVVGEGSTVDNAQIRAALSNTAPILYDVSTGVFSFDANATFSGKTTDDLPQGNSNIYFSTTGAAVSTTNLPEGTNLYFTAARARGNVSATTATGISYNSGTGVFSLSAIPNSSLSTSAITINGTSVSLGGSRTLTTADIAENTNLYFTAARARGNVSAVDAGGYGSFSYNSTSGAFTYTGPSDSDIRGRISSLNTGTGFGNVSYDSGTGVISYERVTQSQVRNSFSVTDTGGDGSLTYNSGTGVITYTGPSASEVRAHLSATNSGSGFGNIAYNNSTGVTTYTRVSNADIASSILNNTIKLKNYSETAVDYGNSAGNITVDLSLGTIHEYTLVGNVTFISFANAVAGSSATLIFKQDIVGGRQLDTTTYTWTGWEFAGNSKSLSLAANSKDVMTVVIPDTGEYYSSIVSMEAGTIPNSQLANSNVVVNGVTIALGSSGNIDTFNSNVTVNGNLNVAGNLNYQNVTDLYVTDQKITLNSNAATNSNVEIISNRPTATNTMLKWNEQATRWEFTNDGTMYYAIATSTTDLAEGSNLWFTTARANSAMDARLVGGTGISYTAGTIALDFTEFDTGNITEGSNLYFTSARVRSNISVAENLTYSNSTGVIGMANSLANVSTITAEATKNIVLNTASGLITQQQYSNTNVYSGNISSDGYAFFASNAYDGTLNYFNYTGNANIENFVIDTGNAVEGSNAIVNVSLLNYFTSAPVSLSNVRVNSFFSRDESEFLPFPVGTRVTSVDVANSIVYMSQNAVATLDLSFQDGVAPNGVFELNSALHDSQTGFTVSVFSDGDFEQGSYTTLFFTSPYPASRYGYPASGPAITDFDVVTDGTISDYSLGTESLAQFFIGRNKIQSPKSPFQAPRGLIVGEGADLTNRAENDMLPSFGVNVLWDGQTDPAEEYGGNFPLTQILVKNYTGNNLQEGTNTRSTFGPRLFFTAAEGNASQPVSVTYPKKNLELGRVSWWSTSSTAAGLSSGAPPAWISGVAGQDCVDNNSGVGMYFAVSPNTANFNRSLYMASSLGNTLIASAQDNTGSHRPIIFAPSHVGSSQGNSVLLYNQTVNGTDTITDTIQTSGAHFAQINFNDTGARTGAKVSVTNGNNSNSNREGNITLSIDRNSTTANTTVQSRVASPPTAFNYYGNNNPDRVRFTFTPDGLVDGTAVTINGFTNATVAGALNGNVFYVKGVLASGVRYYELYTDSGLTTGVNLGVGNIKAGPGTFTYARTNGVTAKEWTMVLAQGSNDLVVAEDGVNRVTFASGGNINLATNASINYDEVYGSFYKSANVTAAAADTIYAFDWTANVTTVASNRVTISDTSRINIAKTGAYKTSVTFQIRNDDNALRTAYIWLRKNGTDVVGSTNRLGIQPKGSATASYQHQVLEWLTDVNGGDYLEVMFAVDNISGISLEYNDAQASPYVRPAIPSAVLVVKPVGA